MLLGFSYSGGHVVAVAAQDRRVAATIAVTPALDGVSVLLQLARTTGLRPPRSCVVNGIRDAAPGTDRPRAVRRASGRANRARVRSSRARTASDLFGAIAGPSWRNEVARAWRSQAGFNRPIRFTRRG